MDQVKEMGVLAFFYLTDDTLKSSDDVEKEFGVMPLTVIPEGNIEAISDKREEDIQKEKKKQRQQQKKQKEKADENSKN